MNGMDLSIATRERIGTIDAVLFDLDGTVVNTIPHILASFRHATQVVLGQALPDDVLLEHVGVPLARQMYSFTDDDAVASELLVVYRAFNHATHDEMALLYDDTLVTLEALANVRMPMGIVTSKGALMANRALDLFGIARYFGAVVTADDTTVHKPDPAPVLEGAARLGVDATRCVYIGDSPADIAAARGSGALAVAATWGVASRERLEAAGPDVVLDTLFDLVGLLGVGEPVA